jgi:FtsP/CotA-like multicopper oxidase with cupredoxin domain
MPDWSVTIQGSPATFTPEPLDVGANDTVSWANETEQPHQLAIDGVTFTEPIAPFTSSTPAYVCQNDTDPPENVQVIVTCVVPGHSSERGTINIAPALLLCALLLGLFVPSAKAQTSTAPIADCGGIIGKELKNPTEAMTRDGMKRVSKGTLVSAGANEVIGFVVGNRQEGSLLKNGQPDSTKIQCFQQWMRTYTTDATGGNQSSTAPAVAPYPGPLLRASVGDLVELTFMNLIEPLRFPNSPADPTKEKPRCEEFATVSGGKTQIVYPTIDKYPDCFNESIFTNVHFHGTHTNPQSTGDNVFLQFAPMPRAANTSRTLMPDPNQGTAFADLFQRCEAQLASSTRPVLWPRLWNDAPPAMPGGPPTIGAPDSFKKWTTDTLTNAGATMWYQQNLNAIANGAWPQNYIGAYPYCYRLPECDTTNCMPNGTTAAAESAHAHGAGAAEMDETQAPQRPLQMAQAPGTHWYHAHKHGSTTINVSNGMTGVFIIEGAYDKEIRDGYPGGIATKVMVINQLGGTPNLARGAGGADPYFSVNGQLQPTVTMQPGEVQWWRIADTSSRAGVFFLPPTDLSWKQLAQDGVQFSDTNYTAASNLNRPFLLASGNRADLLVKAPTAAGTYPVFVYNTVDPSDRAASRNPTQLTLLNVVVVLGPDKKMNFLDHLNSFPPFLVDIPADKVQATRTIVFASSSEAGATAVPAEHTIDGKLFDGEVGAAIVLNQTEEWKVVNETYPNDKGKGNRISHPFHIHINPFQVVEVFDPNATVAGSNTPVYITSGTPGTGQCLIDTTKPETWKPCANVPPPPNIWWDVFSIPSGAIMNGQKIPGYFKMRSRFVDYAGYYVLHCHILAHEDRGMMTVVYVTPLQPPFSHH